MGRVHGSDFYGGSNFPVSDGRFLVVDASVRCLCFSVGGFPSSLLSLSSDFDLDWCGGVSGGCGEGAEAGGG